MDIDNFFFEIYNVHIKQMPIAKEEIKGDITFLLKGYTQMLSKILERIASVMLAVVELKAMRA